MYVQTASRSCAASTACSEATNKPTTLRRSSTERWGRKSRGRPREHVQHEHEGGKKPVRYTVASRCVVVYSAGAQVVVQVQLLEQYWRGKGGGGGGKKESTGIVETRVNANDHREGREADSEACLVGAYHALGQ